MTSLALLPQLTRAAAPPFNSTFYATAATVIPVLFLAIAVQGPFFDELLDLYVMVTRRARQDDAAGRSALRALVAADRAGAPLRIALATLIYGAIAEILAIVALYQQHAPSFTGRLARASPRGAGTW